jgi:hypothetical protein
VVKPVERQVRWLRQAMIELATADVLLPDAIIRSG